MSLGDARFDDITRPITITTDMVTKAVREIRSAAHDAAEIGRFLDMIAPAPHLPPTKRDRRRALPRRGVEG